MQTISQELLDHPIISQAIALLDVRNFTQKEMAEYDQRVAKVKFYKLLQKEARAEGVIAGAKIREVEIAKTFKSQGFTLDVITAATNVNSTQIEKT